jgi:hypothetical protein
MTPTARTLDHLRRAGFIAEVVERWIPRANIRKDFLGCVDIIAFHRSRPGIVGVQATSLPNVAARLTKAKGRPELAAWLRAGGQFQVWGWAMHTGRWTPKVVEVQASDLNTQAVVIVQPGRRSRRREQAELFK